MSRQGLGHRCDHRHARLRHPTRGTPPSTVVVVALGVTVVGGAGLVACEVVAETAIARIVPGDVLGRVMGVFSALSVAVMIAGAVITPVLIARDLPPHEPGGPRPRHTARHRPPSPRARRTRRPDPGKRAEALASRFAVLEQLPITTGVPRLVLEQLASQSQLCPLPPGVDVIVQGAPAAHVAAPSSRGRVIVHRDEEKVGPPRTGRALRGPRPARQRTEERKCHHRNRQHDPPAGGKHADRGAAIRRDIAECARSLERVTGAGLAVASRTHCPCRRSDARGWKRDDPRDDEARVRRGSSRFHPRRVVDKGSVFGSRREAAP